MYISTILYSSFSISFFDSNIKELNRNDFHLNEARAFEEAEDKEGETAEKKSL